MSIFETSEHPGYAQLTDSAEADLALDQVDRALIAALVEDGRMSFRAIGERIGLAGDATRERYTRLMDQGVVRVVGVPRPASVGLNVAAAIGLSISGPLSGVARDLAEVPNVTLVTTTFGSFDIIIEMVAADDVALFDAIETYIRTIPSVRQCNTMRYTHIVKWAASSQTIPVGSRERPFIPSDEDKKILRLLLEDGRASFKDIADATGFHYAQVRRRIKALIETGIVQINTVVNRPAIGDAVMAGVMLRVAVRPISEVAAELAQVPGVEIIIMILGTYDLLLEVACPDLNRLNELLAKIRLVPGVVLSETFTYVRIKRLPIQWGAHAALS